MQTTNTTRRLTVSPLGTLQIAGVFIVWMALIQSAVAGTHESQYTPWGCEGSAPGCSINPRTGQIPDGANTYVSFKTGGSDLQFLKVATFTNKTLNHIVVRPQMWILGVNDNSCDISNQLEHFRTHHVIAQYDPNSSEFSNAGISGLTAGNWPPSYYPTYYGVDDASSAVISPRCNLLGGAGARTISLVPGQTVVFWLSNIFINVTPGQPYKASPEPTPIPNVRTLQMTCISGCPEGVTEFIEGAIAEGAMPSSQMTLDSHVTYVRSRQVLNGVGQITYYPTLTENVTFGLTENQVTDNTTKPITFSASTKNGIISIKVNGIPVPTPTFVRNPVTPVLPIIISRQSISSTRSTIKIFEGVTEIFSTTTGAPRPLYAAAFYNRTAATPPQISITGFTATTDPVPAKWEGYFNGVQEFDGNLLSQFYSIVPEVTYSIQQITGDGSATVEYGEQSKGAIFGLTSNNNLSIWYNADVLCEFSSDNKCYFRISDTLRNQITNAGGVVPYVAPIALLPGDRIGFRRTGSTIFIEKNSVVVNSIALPAGSATNGFLRAFAKIYHANIMLNPVILSGANQLPNVTTIAAWTEGLRISHSDARLFKTGKIRFPWIPNHSYSIGLTGKTLYDDQPYGLIGVQFTPNKVAAVNYAVTSTAVAYAVGESVEIERTNSNFIVRKISIDNVATQLLSVAIPMGRAPYSPVFVQVVGTPQLFRDLGATVNLTNFGMLTTNLKRPIWNTLINHFELDGSLQFIGKKSTPGGVSLQKIMPGQSIEFIAKFNTAQTIGLTSSVTNMLPLINVNFVLNFYGNNSISVYESGTPYQVGFGTLYNDGDLIRITRTKISPTNPINTIEYKNVTQNIVYRTVEYPGTGPLYIYARATALNNRTSPIFVNGGAITP
jgi:hypothetical protein